MLAGRKIPANVKRTFVRERFECTLCWSFRWVWRTAIKGRSSALRGQGAQALREDVMTGISGRRRYLHKFMSIGEEDAGIGIRRVMEF
jgi:hypothetical protein